MTIVMYKDKGLICIHIVISASKCVVCFCPRLKLCSPN